MSGILSSPPSVKGPGTPVWVGQQLPEEIFHLSEVSGHLRFVGYERDGQNNPIVFFQLEAAPFRQWTCRYNLRFPGSQNYVKLEGVTFVIVSIEEDGNQINVAKP